MFFNKGFNYVLPLINLVYLINVIDLDYYGIIIFGQAIVNYFQYFCEYGFYFSGSKEIAEASNSKRKQSVVFSEILVSKLVLLVISVAILCVLLLVYKQIQEISNIIIPLFIGMLFFSFTPTWYFLGIQRMRNITAINILSKVVLTLLIFTVIDDKEDYVYFPILLLASHFIPLVYSYYSIYYVINLKFFWPKWHKVRHQLQYSFNFFIGAVSGGAIYSNIAFMIGLFYSNVEVGIYGLAEKLIRAISSLIQPISHAIFPFITERAQNDTHSALQFAKKATSIIVTMMLLVAIISYVAANILGGLTFDFVDKFNESATYFKFLLVLLPIDSIIHVYGSQGLILLKKEKVYRSIYFVSLCLNLTISLLLIPSYGVLGGCISLICTQSFILALMIYFIEKKRKRESALHRG